MSKQKQSRNTKGKQAKKTTGTTTSQSNQTDLIESIEEVQKEQEVEQTVGLGDVVETVTEATGIKKLVKWLKGEDCGCDERKEKLNKIPVFKYKKTIECLTENEHDFLTGFYQVPTARVSRETTANLVLIYNRVFKANENPKTNCGTCIAKVVRELKTLWETYEG